MPLTGLCTVRGWRVVTLVAGQLQVRLVQQREPPVQLQVPIHDLGAVFESGQVRLVLRIVEFSLLLRLFDGREGALDAVRREVLDPSVIFVQAGQLPCRGKVEFGHRSQSISHPRRLDDVHMAGLQSWALDQTFRT